MQVREVATMAIVPVGVGVGSLFVCHKINELTDHIADTIEDLTKKLKDILKELKANENKDSCSSLDDFESFHDLNDSQDVCSSIPAKKPRRQSSEELKSIAPCKPPKTIEFFYQAKDSERSRGLWQSYISEPTEPQKQPAGHKQREYLTTPMAREPSEQEIQVLEPETHHPRVQLLTHESPTMSADSDQDPKIKLKVSIHPSRSRPENLNDSFIYSTLASRPQSKESLIGNKKEDAGLEPLSSKPKSSDCAEKVFEPTKTGPVSRDHVQPTTSRNEPTISKQQSVHASDSFGTLHRNKDCSENLKTCILSTDWVEEIDRLLDGNDIEKERAYHTLLSNETDYPQCAELLWRLAKGAHQIASIPHQNKTKKREFVHLSRKYATRALEENLNNPESHKWYAIASAGMSAFVELQEKINNACSFKKHLDIALSLRPTDHTLHHMLGKWCLEVARMTWQEHKETNVLCWCLLNATLEDSVKHFKQAYDLKPRWKHNIQYLTKAYLECKDYSNALNMVKKGLQLPNSSEEDSLAHDELVSIHNAIVNYPTQSSHDQLNLHAQL